jgi:hypothetical protein
MTATFDPRKTTDIQSLVMHWSRAPIADLLDLMEPGYRYGYIGTEDRTMYPVIVPGAIVQIDEQRTRILPGPWPTENQRPIYFLDIREGFACCWCSVQAGNIILQPHPLSAMPARVLRLGHDADVLGQVVGVAMRLNPNSGSPQEGETCQGSIFPER